VVTGTSGTSRVTRAHVAELADGRLGDRAGIGCDLLLVSGGWNPAVHLYSQARGRLSYDDSIGAFLPGTDVDGVGVAGSARGRFTLGECLRDGAAVARSALAACGLDVPEPATPVTGDAEAGPSLTLWSVPDPAEQDCGSTQFVDLQRDASVTDILRATGAGLRSVEHVKRYTTIGTAHDQGKTSGIISSGIVADALGVRIADLGTTTFRPPYTPVSFAALAGRDRGHLHDPERVTPLHEWHVRAGARFEDASTLGKIEVEGADAGRLLDLVYTNLISTLKVGAIRYGVMCGVDGMTIDDGTVMRLADDRFLLTTTTGNAATILDGMEEWLQTEWPHQ
jgi:sarcosine oxidase subunit alpha